MKRTKLTRVLAIVLVVMCMFALAACGGNKDAAPSGDAQKELTVLKIGTQVSYEGVFVEIQKAMKEKGYDVQLTMFEDYVAPNTAVMEGSLDANFFQHKPYMDAYNASNNGKLVALEPYWMHQLTGMYSMKHATLADLPDGADIMITADPSSQSLALKLLRDAGLIELGEAPADGFFTTFQITSNPKNLNIILGEMGTNVAAYQDVDALVIATLGLQKRGLDYSNPLYLSEDFSEFPMVIAVHEDNKDAQWAKDLMEVATAPGMKDVINKEMAGTFIAIFE